MVPFTTQVYPDRHIEKFKKIAAKDWGGDGGYALTSEIPRAAGVAVTDLLPIAREAAKAQDLYFSEDTHWRPAGHRLVAEVLHDLIVNEYRAEKISRAKELT